MILQHPSMSIMTTHSRVLQHSGACVLCRPRMRLPTRTGKPARTSLSTVSLTAGSVMAEQTTQAPTSQHRRAHRLRKSPHVPMRQGPRAHNSASHRAPSCARHGLGTHSTTVCQHSRGSSSSIGGTAKVLHCGCPRMAASFSAQPRKPAVCAASRQEEPQRQNQQQSLDLPREQDGASPGGQHCNTLVCRHCKVGCRRTAGSSSASGAALWHIIQFARKHERRESGSGACILAVDCRQGSVASP